MKFIVTIGRDEDGPGWPSVLRSPVASGQGKSKEEALENVREAIGQ